MAKKITIPITDHSEEDVCTHYYMVSYKLSADPAYTQLPPVYTDTIEINNLLDDVLYHVRIIRFCCNGLQSAPLNLDIITTIS